MMLKGFTSRSWLLLMLGMALIVMVLLPPVLPNFIVVVLTQSLILAIVAMSLDILIGYTDLGALGHGAFFAIGAYTTAILATRYGSSFSINLIASIGMASGASALLAILTLRTAGTYFLLITLAVSMSVWGLIYRWGSLTGGENGIAGVPRPDLGIGINMSNHLYFYYLILIAFLICFALILFFIRSPFGKTLVGIRENELRMKVLGYNVWLHKYIALIVAGAFAGLGGCLFSYFNNYVGPDEASLGQCMEFVLMVCIGGPGTVFGGIIGAVTISFAKHWVSIFTDRWLMVLALIYIVTAKFAPDGLLGFFSLYTKRHEVK